MKIRLERWKEIVRLEIVEGTFLKDLYEDTNSIRIGKELISYLYADYTDAEEWGVIYFSEYEHTNIIKAVEQYNNSIKDDGYIVYCDKCSWNCKRKDTICKVKCSCQVAFWQKINNNKIEIIEE